MKVALFLAAIALADATDRSLRTQFQNGQAVSTSATFSVKSFFTKMKANTATVGKTIKLKCAKKGEKYKVEEVSDFKPSANTRPRRNAVHYTKKEAEAIANMFAMNDLESTVEKSLWDKVKGKWKGSDKMFLVDSSNNAAGTANDIAAALVDTAGTAADVAGGALPAIGAVIATKSAWDANKAIAQIKKDSAAKGCAGKDGKKAECDVYACQLTLKRADRALNIFVMGATGTLIGLAGASISLASFGAAVPFAVGGGLATLSIVNKILQHKGGKHCDALNDMYKEAPDVFETLGSADGEVSASDKTYSEEASNPKTDDKSITTS